MKNNNGHKLNGKTSSKEEDNVVHIHKQQEKWRKEYRAEKKTQKRSKLKEDIKDYLSLFNFNLPPLTKFLVLSFFIIHLVISGISLFFSSALFESTLLLFAFIPGSWTGAYDFHITTLLTPITHMFLHGGWFHLFINCAMLMAFGTAMEKWIGSKRMIAYFFLCGLCGAALHFIFYPFSLNPVIGASGGISGLFAGALLMFRQKSGLTSSGNRGLLPMIAVWIFISLIFALLSGSDGSSLAWAAHIGGFLGGFVLLKTLFKN